MVLTCVNDASCPSAYVCLAGMKTWNSTGSDIPDIQGCYCSTWYGNNGVNCSGFDTPTAKYWITVSSINASMAVGLLVFCVMDFMMLFQGMHKFKWDAHIVCIVQLAVAFTFLGAGEIVYALQPAQPESFAFFDGEKVPTTYLAGQVFDIIGVTSVFLASVSLALVWLNVGLATQYLKQQYQTMTRIPLIAFQITFVLVMLITLFVLTGSLFAFVAIVFELIVLITFLVGFCILSRALNSAASHAPVAPESPQAAQQQRGTPSDSSSGAKFHEVLRDMRRTLIFVVTFQGLTLIFSIIGGALLLLYGWREVSGPPGGPVPAVIFFARISLTAVALLGGTVFEFTHRATKRRLRRLQELSPTATARSGAGHTGDGVHKSTTGESSSAAAGVGAVRISLGSPAPPPNGKGQGE